MVADVGEVYTSFAEQLVRIVGSQMNASTVVIDDACQFAWYRLIVRDGRINQDAVMSWLVTTATREATKLVRRDHRELSLEAQVDEDGELNIASPMPGPYEQAEGRERLAQVSALPVRQQRFLWLRAVGYSYAEIAGSESGLTERTVERQIHHGRCRLEAAVGR